MSRAYCVAVGLGAALLLLGNGATAEPDKGKAPRVKFEIRLAEKEPAEGLEEMTVPKSGNKIYVHKRAALGNADVAEARVVKDARERPAVEIIFAEASRKKVGEFSGKNVGKMAAIFFDGKLVSAPVLRAKFSERAEITGDFTREEAERIAKGLSAK